MKKILSILLVVAMVLSFAACGQPGSSDVPISAPAEEAVPAPTDAPSYYPVTVTDQLGREVTIEQDPQRIVTAYYITSSLLIALDLDDRIVGIENNPEKRAIYGLGAPQLLELPQIGTAKELDVEAVMALEPDLLVLPMKLKSIVPTLEELGLTVLIVDPEDQARVNGMIQLVGQATNRSDLAESILSWIASQQEFLEEALQDVQMPTVYLAGNSSMLKTAGDAMYQADMIRLAGGANVAAAIEDTYWAEIDYEQLLAWDPEYIILAAEATYSVEDVLADPNLADCKAVVNGNVYRLPNQAEAWDSPVPGSILGAVWLANILHPDKISDAECTARMNAFYETFYHFSYSEN
jgi:iron complex transport system substrate-binding protein